MNIPTPEYMKEAVHYDADAGLFVWKHRNDMPKEWNVRWVGRTAGWRTTGGYAVITINGKYHKSHRVAWVIHTGEWPDRYIDHINGDSSDNRIANLRQATPSENSFNAKGKKERLSGLKGAHWDKQTGMWKSQIQLYGVNKHLGRYVTKEEAHAAYCEAAARLHGEFANTGAVS